MTSKRLFPLEPIGQAQLKQRGKREKKSNSNFVDIIHSQQSITLFQWAGTMQATPTINMLTILLVSLFALPLADSLSCSSYTSSRTKTICDYYSSESSVYKARITASQCKCGLGTPTLFSCIDFRLNPNGSVVGTVQRLFNCSDSRGLYYRDCDSIINNLGISKSYYRYTIFKLYNDLTLGNTSIINNTVSPEAVSCVNISYVRVPEDYSCAVTYEPCYYTAVVEVVYKGSIQVK